MFFLLLIFPISANADMRIQMLDSQISNLRAELASKQKALSECESKLKTNKVVGGVTLAATAVGVVANVKINEKINSLSSAGGVVGASMPTDTRSVEQKNCESCGMFIEMGISPLPSECEGCA